MIQNNLSLKSFLLTFKQKSQTHGMVNVADKYGTTSNFARHMKTKHENVYELWLAKKNVNVDTKQRNIDDMIK